jgi:fibronectin type 3 domain-containing protein
MGAAMTIALSGTGAAANNYEVELSWDAPASSTDPVVGYHVYRANSSGSYVLLNSSANPPTSYTDTTVVAGTTYNYEVKSVDASGVESLPSGVFTAAIP